MKTETSVKAILVIIALLLAVLALRPVFATNLALANPGKFDITVLCSSCTIPQDHNHGYVILLDNSAGDIWAFREINQKPIYMGKLTLPKAR